MAAIMDTVNSGQPIVGVTYGFLTESHPDRIHLDAQVFYLYNGKTCDHTLRTRLKVVFLAERDGRRYVVSITRDRSAH